MSLLRVLILEDDEDIVDLIESILGTGYEYITAENGLDGLQMAEAGEPDLVICDVMMPVMDGWEFMRALRMRTGFEHIPVIFLSALSAQDQIRKGYSLGAALYLTKPVIPSRLKRNIELFISDHGIEPRAKKMRAYQLRSSVGDLTKPVEFPFAKPVRPQSVETQPEPLPPQRPKRTPIITPPPPGHDAPSEPAPQKMAQEPIKEETVARPTTPAPEKPAGSGEIVRIMIIDDDKDTCQMVSAGLSGEFEVVEAYDGIAAIERAIRYKPDIFIIDGMLPRMTGYQLTMMLKKNREFYKTPIIFISGKATQRDQDYAKSLGVSQFVAKPFTTKQVLGAIRIETAKPNFTPHADRPPIKAEATPEYFPHMEAYRKATETPTLSDIERQSIVNQVKQQHPD